MQIMANGISMAYSEEGDPQGPAIIFIHAFPFTRAMWREQVQALKGKFRVITYDLRGFGESELGEVPISVDLLADDLVALQEKLKIEKATWCGLSLGGYIALRAKEIHPQKVTRLVLADTRVEPDTDEGRIKRFQTVKLLFAKGVETFASGFVKNVVAPETLAEKPEILIELEGLVRKNSVRAISQALVGLAARTDTSMALKRDALPTLILVGANDQLTPVSSAEKMHRLAEGSKLVVLPKAGHLACIENPEGFNAALTRFLS